jgi:hypothetical protein
MKERPILFSAPMVRAILDGTKTQTRRIVADKFLGDIAIWSRLTPWHGSDSCPYGRAGDQLWVRETHQLDPPDDGTWGYVQWTGCKESTWRDIPPRFQHPRHVLYAATWKGSELLWRPSIFMPRWASRINLKITNVRAERLQEISEDDAKAEGTQEPSLVPIIGACWSERDAYAKLWEHINGKGSWVSNPWVWVVSFERITNESNEGQS